MKLNMALMTIIDGGEMLFSDMCVQYQHVLKSNSERLFRYDPQYIPKQDDIMVEIGVTSRKCGSWCKNKMPDDIITILNRRAIYQQFVHYLPLRALILGSEETIDIQLSNKHYCIFRKYGKFNHNLNKLINKYI